MKYIYLLAATVALLIFSSCADVGRPNSDSIIYDQREYKFSNNATDIIKSAEIGIVEIRVDGDTSLTKKLYDVSDLDILKLSDNLNMLKINFSIDKEFIKVIGDNKEHAICELSINLARIKNGYRLYLLVDQPNQSILFTPIKNNK